MNKKSEKSVIKINIDNILIQLIPAIFSIYFTVFSYETCFSQDTLTFKDCINISLEKNYSIQIIRNEELVAANNVTLGNAGFLPTIGAEGRISQSVVNSEQVFFSRPDEPQIGRNARSKAVSANTSLNWTIFDGFGMFVSYNRLRDLLEAGKLSTRMNVENLIAMIGAEYYELMQQEQRLETFKYVMKLSGTRMLIAEERYRIGKESKLEFQQAKVDYNSDSSQYMIQQESVFSSRIKLNNTMGINLENQTVIKNRIAVDFELDYARLQEKTLQQNTGLQIAENSQQLSEEELRYLLSQIYPVITLTAGYNYNKSESQTGFQLSRKEYGYNYGVMLSYNFFNGFEFHRQRQNAIINIRSAELQYDLIKRQVLADLAVIYNLYQNSLNLIALEESNLQTARENFEIAIEKFHLGTLSGLEMRDIQRVFLDAEDRLLAAQYQAKLAEISLKQISGRISEYL